MNTYTPTIYVRPEEAQNGQANVEAGVNFSGAFGADGILHIGDYYNKRQGDTNGQETGRSRGTLNNGGHQKRARRQGGGGERQGEGF